jgi:hypothetical protein
LLQRTPFQGISDWSLCECVGGVRFSSSFLESPSPSSIVTPPSLLKKNCRKRKISQQPNQKKRRRTRRITFHKRAFLLWWEGEKQKSIENLDSWQVPSRELSIHLILPALFAVLSGREIRQKKGVLSVGKKNTRNIIHSHSLWGVEKEKKKANSPVHVLQLWPPSNRIR